MLELPFPDNWSREKLHTLADWTNGRSFSTSEFSEAGQPILKIAELKSGITSQTKFTEKDFKPKYRVTEGDMLFSWSGNPETSIDVFWWRGPNGWLNQHIFKVEAIDSVDQAFLYYLLKYLKPVFTEIARNKQTTGLGHITQQDLKRLSVGVPSLPIQHEITSVIQSFDDKGELNRRMNHTLESMARAIFKSWFVDFDLVRAKAEGRRPFGMNEATAALFPNEFEHSDIGEIPKGWRPQTIDDVAEVIDCLHSRKPDEVRDSDHMLLQVHNIGQHGDLDLSRPYRVAEDDYQEWTRRIEVKGGDILISKTGRVGAVAQVPHHVRAGIGRNLVAIRPKEEWLFPSFFKELMLSRHMEREIQGNTSSGTVLQSIHVKHIRRLRFATPPSRVIEEFEDTVSTLHRKIEVNMWESGTLGEIRDALLPRLMSGEIEVETVAKGVSETTAG